MVARWAHNPKVAGSSPALATNPREHVAIPTRSLIFCAPSRLRRHQRRRRLRPLESSKFSKIRCLDYRLLVPLASLVSSKKHQASRCPSRSCGSEAELAKRESHKPRRVSASQAETHITQTKRNLTVSLCCLHIVLNVSNQFRGEISFSHSAKIYQVSAFSKFILFRAVTHQHDKPPKDNKV